MERVVAPGLALLAACFSPDPPAGASCADGQPCAVPLACIEGVCQRPTPPADAFVEIDGPLMCSPPFSMTASGACHLQVSAQTPWLSAELDCELRGGHLAVPDNMAEAREIQNQWWIGVSDRAVEGEYRAVTGAVVEFEFWAPNEPTGGMSNCVHSGAGSLWNDGPCDVSFAYVCELDGRPPAAGAF